jgi:hypothetical protein
MSALPPAAGPPASTSTSAPLPPPAESRRLHRHGGEAGRSPFVPLLVFFAAALAWSGFQFQQLRLETETLSGLRATQEAQFLQAQKVRATLDMLALETQKLADAGNTNARTVVDELRKRGITINRPTTENKK